jgi:small subunit ribosomal protein S1
VDEARDAPLEGARGGAAGRRPGARHRSANRALAAKQTERSGGQVQSRWRPTPQKSITDFGLFVELEEGIDGLVHVSDLHWTKKVKHPSEFFKKGDDVEAVVLGIDVDNERISLGIKQLTEDPWSQVPKRYPAGARVRGKVSSVTDFGVFVEIEEGVEGLVHVSQLSTERVDRPSSLYKVGDEIEAEVTQVDASEKRIALSIKALRRSEERDEVDAYMQREREGGKFSFADIMTEDLEARDKNKG